MFVISAISELRIFVASSLPPSPVSITRKSGFFLAKNIKAINVVISKKLKYISLKSIFFLLKSSITCFIK